MSVSSTGSIQVVLGGQSASHLVARLIERGLRVRWVRRSTFGPDAAPLRKAGVELISADVANADHAAEVMRGAAAVYHCATPAYTEWATQLLPMTRGILSGARKVGAHLVVLDNLYVYGRSPGGVMSEDTPVAPCSRKGDLRARAAEELFAARDRGDLAVTVGRASDYFGPGATLTGVFGDAFWKRVLKGKAGPVFGDPDHPHSYSYLPDVAKALVTLGTDDRARNQLWHLPVNPAETTRAVMARIGRALGHEVPAAQIPSWVVRGMGVFSPLLREVAEMRYEWEAPFVLDDRKFRETFGDGATPWDEAIAQTTSWARKHYGGGLRSAA